MSKKHIGLEEKKRKLTPEENKAAKKERKRVEREHEKLEIKRRQELAQKPAIERAWILHRKAFIVWTLIILLLLGTGITYLVSPGVMKGDSYKFMSYGRYVTLGDYDKLTYDKDAKKSEAQSALLEDAVKQAKMKKYPSKQVKFEKEQLEKLYQNMASAYNMSYDQLKQAMGGTTDKKWDKQLTKSAKTSVKQKMVTYAIAKDAGMDLSKSGYNKYLKKELKAAGMTEKQFKKQMGEDFKDYADENDMYSTYVSDVVMKGLYKSAKAK